MRNQYIEFIQMNENRMPFNVEDAFKFRKDRPYHWLQKLCCWILKKLGAYYTDYTIKITRHTINTQSFLERLFKQQAHIEEAFNMRPTRLLIGAEDFTEMMGCEEIRQVFQFTAEYRHGRSIMGLAVEVIPWMRGILVMP